MCFLGCIAAMDGEKEKFDCPHCNEVMDVDMIYHHVRRIFNSSIYKCSECDFSTNDTFNHHYHKTTTEHRLEDKSNLHLLLEKAIISTETIFTNSVVGRSGNKYVVKNITKPGKTREIGNSEKHISVNTIGV
uniref:C2H2-type domain-containing protein n=1 Tax=Strongyloides venezuelensis TaxID=75913 RepID=A0A0K0F8B5_STRVS